MKKITLLIILLAISFGYAQQQQYVLDFEPGAPSGDVATWNNAFGGTSPVEIVTNPDPDGVNTSATTMVLKTTLGAPLTAEFWAGIDNSQSGEAFGTWKIDMGVTSNLTLTMDINKNYVGTIGIKMATTTSGTTFEIGDQNVDNAIVDEWQTISFDLSGINPVGDLTNISDMVLFVDYTKTNGRVGGPSEYILYVDNIKWNAEKLTDPTGPTCNDGIQNGDETGVDCGGSSCAACVAIPSPTTAPSTPTIGSGMTISLFSDAYTDLAATWNPNWGQTTVVTDETIASNLLKKYENFNYSGVEPTGGTIDASSMTYINLDYWTSDATDLKIKLVDYRGDGAWGSDNIEVEITKAVTTNAWGTISIPLTDFTTANPSMILTDIGQLVLSATGATNPVYLDNFYFSVGSALGVNAIDKDISFNAYPNPTRGNWNIRTYNHKISSVEVFNILGKRVMTLSSNSKDVDIDGSNLETGLYIAQIKTDSGIKSLKLIKK